MSFRLLLLSLLWSSSQAAGLRAPSRPDRGLQNLLADPDDIPNLNCSQELSFDIFCQGDCNFDAQKGTCESKMFQYHGGPCRASSTIARTSSDSAANCQDFRRGPPSEAGHEVYVVISDPADPLKNSSMWTQVGGFFWTDYRDYHNGVGLSDQQNITFYSSNKTSYKTMLQTMLFHAPCEGPPLDRLDRDQSVQLFATAVDPKIRASFLLRIQSLTAQRWQLDSASVVYTSDPQYLQVAYQDVVIDDSDSAVGNVRLPLVVEINRNDTLSILGEAKLLTPTGLECSIAAIYVSHRPPAGASKASFLSP